MPPDYPFTRHASFVGTAHEEAFYSVDVLSKTDLLDAPVQLARSPAMTLLASSANMYGNGAQSPIPEGQPLPPFNHYAMSKMAMECLARTYMNRLRLVIARPFNYTGPGQRPFAIPKLARHIAQRAPWVALGNLQVERDFNDVRSVCAAYLLLLKQRAAAERITGRSIDARVDPDLVRPSDIYQLCGDPRTLKDLTASSGLP